MSEEITKTPSTVEVNKAESFLTPEQREGSQARYEIRKHEKSLLEAGVSEKQIKQSAELASAAAEGDPRLRTTLTSFSSSKTAVFLPIFQIC